MDSLSAYKLHILVALGSVAFLKIANSVRLFATKKAKIKRERTESLRQAQRKRAEREAEIKALKLQDTSDEVKRAIDEASLH